MSRRHIYVYVYVYLYISTGVHIYIYMHIYRQNVHMNTYASLSIYTYGPGSLIVIFRNFSEQNIDLGAVLDADLDAQRDFAPQCIIQKQN